MLLEQRLKLVHYWKSEKHRAAVANANVDAPLFVVGLPRTGTSFLHTLLSQDSDNFRSPLNWMASPHGIFHPARIPTVSTHIYTHVFLPCLPLALSASHATIFSSEATDNVYPNW